MPCSLPEHGTSTSTFAKVTTTDSWLPCRYSPPIHAICGRGVAPPHIRLPVTRGDNCSSRRARRQSHTEPGCDGRGGDGLHPVLHGGTGQLPLLHRKREGVPRCHHRRLRATGWRPGLTRGSRPTHAGGGGHHVTAPALRRDLFRPAFS
jgi:hypothetical protein